MKVKTVISVIGMFFLLGGCFKSPGDCFKSTGTIAKEERTVLPYHKIELHNNVNLYLINGTGNTIKVEAGKNLLEKIETKTDETGMLVIKNENSCNWVRDYRKPVNVYLPAGRVDSILYQSIGNIYNGAGVDTLYLDSLSIEVKEGSGTIALTLSSYFLECALHYGTADIRLSGKTELSFVFANGWGKVDNRNLSCTKIYAINQSGNDMFLYATLHLEVSIKGMGNVYYFGKPSEIVTDIQNEGRLIKLE